jgi:phosphomannomutase
VLILLDLNLDSKVLKSFEILTDISKNKIDLDLSVNISKLLSTLESKFKSNKINTIDGLKIDFDDGWVHLRRSNTEPIIRIYSESVTLDKANKLAEDFINQIKELL